MLIDAKHRGWIVGTGLLLAAATAEYVRYARASLNAPTGGTVEGLAFGVAGSALIVFAALYGVRRKFPTLRVGRAQAWLRGHIWLGLLSYPLILYHAGLRLGGPLTIALMVIFTAVIVSGVFGLVLQQFLPRHMSGLAPMETIYEQIDHVAAQLREEARRVVADAIAPAGAATGRGKGKEAAAAPAADVVPKGERFAGFYFDAVEPFLEGRLPQSVLATPSGRATFFDEVRLKLPVELRDAITWLEEICEEYRQLELQRRIHAWLHGWLFVHLPLSAALVALGAVHAVMALRY